jgi:hypothetical protein
MPSPEPGRIARLPHDKHGRPVPWFVAWIDGAPDFRIVKPGGVAAAVALRLCWVCGVKFQRQEHRAFTIGPMCTVNRTSSEPPAHAECAEWSALNCPFLTRPSMVRRERHLPEGSTPPAGIMLARNPGVTAVWTTRYNTWSTFQVRDGKGGARGGVLFDIGPPEWVEWFAEGRKATRPEVLASIRSGTPTLAGLAEEQDGEAGLDRLAEMLAAAIALVPVL